MSDPLRRTASASLFPLLVAGIGTWAVAGSTLAPATRLDLPTALDEILVLLPTVVVFYLGIALLERWLPYRRAWSQAQGDVRTDLLHLFLTGQGANALVRVGLGSAALGGAAWISARLGHGLWPLGWPAPLQLALALAVAELGHYWFHRLTHERPLLWRLHATHHSAPRLYWLNATRFHPLDLAILIAVQSTPLILLGADRRALLMYALFTVVYGQVQHCNVDLRSPGPLNWIFSSHELHRWHHSTDSREGNANYGAVLSLWDLLFGTYFLPRDRAFTGPVGIGKLPHFPQGYLDQLLSPFRWSRVRGDGAGSDGGGERAAYDRS